MLIRAAVFLAVFAIGTTASAQTPSASAAATGGVDCWMPRVDRGPKDPRLEPFRQAMLTVERVVKANQAFTTEMPERVRMEVWTNIGNGSLWLEAFAYPRQFKATPYWTPTGCDIVRTSRGTANTSTRSATSM